MISLNCILTVCLVLQQDNPNEGNTLPVVLIVIGVAVALAVIGLAGFCFRRYRQHGSPFKCFFFILFDNFYCTF